MLLVDIWLVSKMIFKPPLLGAGGIMFSGCPSVRLSVRSLKYPLSICTWVRWSIRPAVTILRHVRPSVCLSVRLDRFLGTCQRRHGGNNPKFCMLMYLGHCQNWLDYGHGLLVFLIFALFWLNETGQICDHFAACPSVCLSAWIGFCLSLCLDRFLGICQRRHGGNGPKFCMLMYLGHCQNWSDYGLCWFF